MKTDKGKNRKLSALWQENRNELLSWTGFKSIDDPSLEAEDIIQDVLLNILNSTDISLPIEKLAAYLFCSIRNRVIDYKRKKRLAKLSLDVEKENLCLVDILKSKIPGPEEKLARKELIREIHQALDKLKDEERRIIIETEFHNKSFKELSLEWQEPAGTLLSRKSRALKKLRKILSEN